MKKNSLILNEADKTLMYLVGADEGHFSLYENMMSVKTLPGSQYLDKLNGLFYQKVANEGKVSDWLKLSSGTATKCAVSVPMPNEIYLGKMASEMQSDVKIGLDGKVTGKVHYVRNFFAFNSTVKAEQNGYYLFVYLPLSQDYDVRKTQTVSVKVGSGEAKEFPAEGTGLPLIVFITKETGTITLEVKNGDSAGTRVLDLSALEFGLDTTL